MKVVDSAGREYVWNYQKLAQHNPYMSVPHETAANIMEEICPSAEIYNEVSLVGCRGINGVILRADIFVPNINIIVEVHGEQHYKFVKHFHKTEENWKNSCRNDTIKQEWCEINGIKYLALKFDETEKWGDQIYERVFGRARQ